MAKRRDFPNEIQRNQVQHRRRSRHLPVPPSSHQSPKFATYPVPPFEAARALRVQRFPPLRASPVASQLITSNSRRGFSLQESPATFRLQLFTFRLPPRASPRVFRHNGFVTDCLQRFKLGERPVRHGSVPSRSTAVNKDGGKGVSCFEVHLPQPCFSSRRRF